MRQQSPQLQAEQQSQHYCWITAHEQNHLSDHQTVAKHCSISHASSRNSNHRLHGCSSCSACLFKYPLDAPVNHSSNNNNNNHITIRNKNLNTKTFNSSTNLNGDCNTDNRSTFYSDSESSPCPTCNCKQNQQHQLYLSSSAYPVQHQGRVLINYDYLRKSVRTKRREVCSRLKRYSKQPQHKLDNKMEDSDSSNVARTNPCKTSELDSESSRLSDLSLCSGVESQTYQNCPTNDQTIMEQPQIQPPTLMDLSQNRFILHSKHVENWSVDDVGHWLETNGFGSYKSLFCDTHRIDGQVLISLTFDDLRNQLNICAFGDLKRLCIAFENLQQFYSPESTKKLPPGKRLSPRDCQDTTKSYSNDSGNSKGFSDNVPSSSNFSIDWSSDETTETDDARRRPRSRASERRKVRTRKLVKGNHHQNHRTRGEFKPELLKALLALLYAFMTTWVTAFVMVIVHDRVPDMDTYPPLPDIILDNLPLIPWAFGMCEFCGLVLLFTWVFILIFHKHRFILIRRMFSLFGSVFLLRCVTMLITSLSVPGRHLNCKARPYGSWSERFYQAYLIWQGGGMSLQGVRTCGDYMYSGHTVVLTMLNFFITEYTPTKFYLIHTVSWILNCFGIFFILAAHEHYSIDVFVAFYISTRIFLYYHTLANNRALYQSDRRRTRIWFPLFSFFEANVPGIVPNEFENPFKVLKNHVVNFLDQYPATSKLFGKNKSLKIE